jgi:hypothetical protein
MLAIDAATCEKIDAAIARARAKPTSAETVTATAVAVDDTIHLSDLPPDFKSTLNPECVAFPFGYIACITFEMQPEAGLCRHLSVSREGGALEQSALVAICTLFGFQRGHITMWEEEFRPGEFAVNFVQPVEMNA